MKRCKERVTLGLTHMDPSGKWQKAQEDNFNLFSFIILHYSQSLN